MPPQEGFRRLAPPSATSQFGILGMTAKRKKWRESDHIRTRGEKAK
jgi:hypothetical protein